MLWELIKELSQFGSMVSLSLQFTKSDFKDKFKDSFFFSVRGFRSKIAWAKYY